MYSKCLIICAIFSLTCAKLPFERKGPDHLVGGRSAKPGEVKYIVAIRSYHSICGGGIIGDKYILTAAHCIKVDDSTSTSSEEQSSGTLLQPMYIIAGTNVVHGYNKAKVIEIHVEEVYLPRTYERGGHYDIAVLKLKKAFNFMRDSDKIQLLKLPEPLEDGSSTYPTYENEPVKFAGYGNTKAEIVKTADGVQVIRTGAGRLQVANAIIDTTETCQKFFKNAQSDEMCLSVVEDTTRKNPQGTCTGDSGSPAVYKNNIVIGLDSRGIWCDNNKAPTLFTRVSSYIPFIKKAMSGDLDGLVVYKAP